MADVKSKTNRRILNTQTIVSKSSTLKRKGVGSKSTSTPVKFPSWLGALVLDVPLAVLFLIFLGTNALFYLNYKIWFPLMAQNQWTEERAARTEQTFHRKEAICEASSVITGKSYKDIVIPSTPSDDVSTHDGAQIVRKHGAGLLSNILTNRENMEQFRRYALEKNRRLGNQEGPVDVVGVIENANRWSFAFGVSEHPSIEGLLAEIGEHQVLKRTLEGLLGPNPSIIELSTITAEEGAKTQGWHFDTSEKGDSLKFANTFSDLYSLLIPVQTTTAEMGATAVCPGTHHCRHYSGCDEVGFQPVASDGLWAAGDGLLFNSHVGHQGMAHVNGPPRVALVISFTSRPLVDNKLLPLAAGYVIPWNTMGFNFNDLKDPATMLPPWSTLRSLGLSGLLDFRNKHKNGQEAGWDFFRFCVSHLGNIDDPPQVVLMPYIKTLPLFLLGQAHHHPIYSPWQAFVIDTLRNVWVFSLALYVVCLTEYLKASSFFETGGKTKKKTFSARQWWARLLLSHGLAFIVVLVIVQHYIGEYGAFLAVPDDAQPAKDL